MFGKNKRESDSVANGVNLISVTNFSSPISEQYRTIRANIQFLSTEERPIRTVGFTSAGPSEGKSTVAANVAVTFANLGKRTLLVDTDLRKPTVQKTFGVRNQSGLSDGLRDNKPINVVETGIDNLFLITAGSRVANPSELLVSNQVKHFVKESKHAFDIVIFDLPPLNAASDAQTTAAMMDATILVVKQGVTRKSAANRAMELLKMADANVIGAVYNSTETENDDGYYYYYSDEESD